MDDRDIAGRLHARPLPSGFTRFHSTDGEIDRFRALLDPVPEGVSP